MIKYVTVKIVVNNTGNVAVNNTGNVAVNVAFTRVRITTISVKRNIVYSELVCSISYAARTAHA